MPMTTKRILVIDRGVPTHDRDSGSLRMYSLLEILAGLDYHVTFIPGDGNPREPYTGDLKKMGIEVLAKDIDRHLKSSGGLFSAVILSRPDEAFKFLPIIRKHAVNSKVIYDTVDIHWVRFQRAADLYRDRNLQEQARHYRAIENINALCSDLTLTVTEEDKNFLLKDNPGLRVEVIPNIHRPEKTETPFHKRKDLMFIGGFYHQPNVDAVLFFAKKVFPLIKAKIPGIKLYVVGSSPPPSITGLNSRDIKVTGFVKDVRPFFENCRVFVSPLRYGAGMKGKIGQSMAHGLPVVTTAVGAEGMSLADGQNALIADEPRHFAEAVARLYTDEELWKTLSANSARHIENNFSPAVVRRKLEGILNSLAEEKVNLPAFYRFQAPVRESGPEVPAESGAAFAGVSRPGGSVLVAGVYLADKKNTIEHLVDRFSRPGNWRVVQKWAAIGRGKYSDRVGEATVLRLDQGLPKYAMINMLLVNEKLDAYDYVIVCDDDITLPPGFLDTFLDIQIKCDFALAQPARTHNSYIDHVIVERLDGLQARRTRFNEIGPLNSFRRDALKLLFPFDVSVSPMGWGYDFAWPLVLEQNGLRTGIIDAAPVDHSLRKPVAYYSHEKSRRQMEEYLAKTPHFPMEEAFTILESYA